MRPFHLLCLFAIVGAPLALAACGAGSSLPPPRSVIVYTGVRIMPDAERMEEVDRWLTPQLEAIRRSRGFEIRVMRTEGAEYPWQSMEVGRDTARVFVQQLAPDTETPFVVYAHYHLMAERGELEQWLPEAEDTEGFELERHILSRLSDVWLYGRSVFNTQPYGPLDELLYSKEYGFLDEFILSSQPERFEDRAATDRAENPERWEAFRSWFQDTFERDGPGYLAAPDEEAGDEPPPSRRRIGR